MHFFRSSAVLLALGLSSSIAAPTSAGLSSRNTGGRPDPNIQFVSTWGDIGWRRYRFQWKNIAPRSCDAYVNAIQGAGGITHNWQCWDGGDGWWYFVSVVSEKKDGYLSEAASSPSFSVQVC